MININTTKKVLEIEGLPDKADSLPNYRYLTNNSIEIKGPMTRYYHWYSRYDKPMAHQIATADFVCRYRRGFILNDIGTGKTMVIYWLADYLRQEQEINRALIIAPLSTLEPVHAKALRDHFPQLSYTILHGSAAKRRNLLAQNKQIYIVNFDGVKVLEPEFFRRNDIDAIFIDEVAVLRHHNTKRWKVFEKLFGAHTGKMCWGLTGSPMPKDPTDCYGQIRLINPAALPTKTLWRGNKVVPISFYDFRDKVMTPGWSKWEWHKRQGWETFVKETMQPAIRFERDECCDLPDCVTETRKIPLSAEQEKAQKSMLNLLRAEFASGEITAINESDKLRKLVQIACGAVYREDGTTEYLDHKPRFDELCQIIDDCSPSHVLVFTPFKNLPARLAGDLNNKYCTSYEKANDYKVAEWVTGDTKASERNDIYDRFTHGKLRFIVATPHCMRHGLNLQDKCWVIVWWAPIEDYEIFEQANGRITRPGQKKKQIIFFFQGTLTEKKIYAKLDNKENAQNILLDIIKER